MSFLVMVSLFPTDWILCKKDIYLRRKITFAKISKVDLVHTNRKWYFHESTLTYSSSYCYKTPPSKGT